jgi:hypothetical protein
MRYTASVTALVLFACASNPSTLPPAPPPPAAPFVAPAVHAEAPAPEPAAEQLAADTLKATIAGNTFIAPAGWSITVRGPTTIVSAPEGNSHVALVDVQAKNADHAVELAWAAYKPQKPWPLKIKNPAPDREGWSKLQSYEYRTSPNEKRDVFAGARFANGMWNVNINDLDHATGEKRGAQLRLIFGQLLPKGYERESFAGKKAHALDPARVAELGKFLETSRMLLGVPGVSLGLVQDGKVVFTGGFGVRELGKPAKVDGDTKYIIASNTKAMTT